MNRVEKRSTATKIAIGMAISVAVEILMLCLVARLLVSGKIGESSMDAITIISMGIASAAGPLLSMAILYDSRVIIPVMIMLGNFTLTICCGFVLDGSFKGVPGPMLAILVGGVSSCVMCMKKTGRRPGRKKRNR